MPERIIKLMRIRVSTPIWLYIIVFGLLAVGALKIEQLVNKTERITRENRHLAIENTTRISDIQASRRSSCKDFYGAVRDLLDIAFKGRQLTPEQEVRLERMRERVSNKKCIKQTALKGGDNG